MQPAFIDGLISLSVCGVYFFMKTIPYNKNDYPFDAHIKAVLGAYDLQKLHEKVEGEYAEQFQVGKDSSTIFHSKFYDQYRAGWPAFEFLYERFIIDVIASLFDEDFLYQKFPTFRVHLQGNIAVGAFHNDADFGHPNGEINYIIPLTDSDDTATVWVESEPGKEDFKPIPMRVGELIQFDGNHLTHGNKKNETGCTRVSMDFRVLPISKYNPENETESVTRRTKFQEGAYYKRFTK